MGRLNPNFREENLEVSVTDLYEDPRSPFHRSNIRKDLTEYGFSPDEAQDFMALERVRDLTESEERQIIEYRTRYWIGLEQKTA